MRVRINGKEVEVGPGRTHKKNCGCIGKIFQTLAEQASHRKSSLTVNGHEVDMDNPDDVQRAIKSCRIIGRIVLCLGIFCLIIVGHEVDWVDFDEGALGGLMAASVWLLLGAIIAFLTPRSLEKRLQELKKQGKIPSGEINSLRQSGRNGGFQGLIGSFIENMQDRLKELQEEKETPEEIKNANSSQKILGWIIIVLGILVLSIMDPDEMKRLNPQNDPDDLWIAYFVPIAFIVAGVFTVFSSSDHSKK